MKTSKLKAILLAVALIIPDAAAPAQTTQPTPAPQPGQVAVPDRVLYFLLFDHITRQDTLATQQAAQGKNGNVFRNYYAGVIGLLAADFETLHGTALSCRAQVKMQDDAAFVVIQAARAKVAAARAKGAPLPPPPPELNVMQQQRTATLTGCMSQLQQRMTPAGFQALDQFLHQQFAKHVQIQAPAASRTLSSSAPPKSDPPSRSRSAFLALRTSHNACSFTASQSGPAPSFIVELGSSATLKSRSLH